MKTIYVNSDGVICACTVPFPNEKDFSGDQWKENNAIQACKNSAVPFEDQEEAHQNIEQRFCIYELRPDTFYQIEVDCEVEIVYKECEECIGTECRPGSCNFKTKVARLKPVSVDKDQEELWRELIDLYDIQDASSYGYGVLINKLSEKFTITRKS